MAFKRPASLTGLPHKTSNNLGPVKSWAKFAFVKGLNPSSTISLRPPQNGVLPKRSLVAGSYERFIWGYKLKSRKHPHSLTLTPLFSFPSHLSTIKTVVVAGSAAVSGGNDDTVKIYNLSTSSEIGSLYDSSSITSLSFFSPPSLSSFPRNLLADDAEGSLSIFDADPFVLLKTVKIHKKAINSLSVHPFGKLALTVGHDECLAMVNLVRGRRSTAS